MPLTLGKKTHTLHYPHLLYCTNPLKTLRLGGSHRTKWGGWFNPNVPIHLRFASVAATHQKNVILMAHFFSGIGIITRTPRAARFFVSKECGLFLRANGVGGDDN